MLLPTLWHVFSHTAMFLLFLLTQIFSHFGFMQTGAVVVTALDTAIELQGCQVKQPCNLYPCPRFSCVIVQEPPAGQLLFVQLFLICCCGKKAAGCPCHDQSTKYIFFYQLASVSIRLKLAKAKVAPLLCVTEVNSVSSFKNV